MNATAPDIPTPFEAALELAQHDALQTLHKIMLRVAASLDKPQNEDPPQARATTQRIRLCLQAARDILRLSPPGEAGNAPSIRPTPSRRSSPALAPHPAQPATTFLAAARAGERRFGERISPSRDSSLVARTSVSHDSGLSTQDSPPPSTLTPGASRLAPPRPPLPPRPKYFTKDEFNQIMAIMGSEHDLLTPALYARIQEWNHYALAAGLSPAFGITEQRLQARSPQEPPHTPPPEPPT